MRAVVISALLVTVPAHADDTCEHVQAVADAESALMVAPTLFGTIGYAKQPESGGVDPVVTAGPRVVAGLSYDFVGLWEGAATKARARAECRRHEALVALQSAGTHQALAARARVLDKAVREAEQMLTKLAAEVRERVATEQELIAMRLRVDDLRRMAVQTQVELARAMESSPRDAATFEHGAASPTGATFDHGAASPTRTIAAAAATFERADAAAERANGRLRRLRGIDVTVRGGYDRFLDRDDAAPYFAMLTVSVNTGVLFQGGANERARVARDKRARDHRALDAQLAAQSARAEQTAALIGDLNAQLALIVKLGGDDGRRYQRTLWFDLVKLEAENAYATAQVETLREVLGK